MSEKFVDYKDTMTDLESSFTTCYERLNKKTPEKFLRGVRLLFLNYKVFTKSS